jgi:NADP-dependent 3-hydroxy acid dehydrogenase YdfG
VIATSSVAGLKAYPGGAVYGGTKWFVRDFMEVLRMESATGISPDRVVNVVVFAIDEPEDTTVNEFTVGPANQPW